MTISRHYHHSWKNVHIDPYRILLLFDIRHPALQHAIKKLLRAGRGPKPISQDVAEAIEGLQRFQQMEIEDAE